MLDRYLGWLVNTVEHADVEIELGRTVDPDSAAALAPDEIVVATGAVWTRPRLPGADEDHVFTVPELEEWLLGYHDTMVGPHVAVSVAARPGCRSPTCAVDVGTTSSSIEPTGVFGVELGPSRPVPSRRTTSKKRVSASSVVRRVESIGSRAVRVRRGRRARRQSPPTR